ncbi:type I-E CRISPR-associated protein Cas6/Cse3/CasE [Thermostichus vulcanus]|uniref:Type I-E CRISPR-associated protein Cas6/Cse3/CasE n=1 Tax=Thermostichus vulcanus str. 'Rupite' TaxID=2813851 RepID=A0ABT0CC81_THEVL|nr:type I-E CRISPR-associated protein Cas6/Cse3/CasE [Thermostichus vulcanus]MCJ2543329.1 type I-E CRISPR-associated protein Cas6/Cse3/CasE [Thermostichus vulcanus str. 'Rupite']
MYLSQLILNERLPQVYRDLSNAHAFHQRIMNGFPDQPTETPRSDWHILYRQEPDSYKVLVQSAIEPDWSCLPDRYLECNVKVKRFDLNPARWREGQLFQFRLRANPSKRDKQTHKIVGFYRREDQLAWLARKGKNYGFSLMSVDAIPSANVFAKKKNDQAPIRIHTVLFEGVLQVVEPTALVKAVQQGIGRGRSYGCGLLSLARM